MITLPANTKALIFDLDGTLADTMPLHFEAWQHTMKKYGGSFSLEQFYGMAGMPTVKIMALVNEEQSLNLSVSEATAFKEQAFAALLPKVKTLDPVVAVVKKYHGKLPMAVATGGVKRFCDKTLAALNLASYFDAIVTADDVTNGKPAPDTFLLAAKKIGIVPEFCCVFEDAELGLQAAKAAKMNVIDVRPFLA